MGATPSLLSANELQLSFGYQRLLEGVTLAVAPGEKVGLVGRNGCGKTSLLKILAGDMNADAGEIFRRRELRIGYLPQEFELDGTKTVLQNIEAGAADLIEWLRRYETGDGSEVELGEILHHIEHADGWNLQSRIESEAHALGVAPMDTLVSTLSGGEKRRVALCRALASQPDLLLLDEPTNHLDAETFAGWRIACTTFPVPSSSSRTTVTSSMSSPRASSRSRMAARFRIRGITPRISNRKPFARASPSSPNVAASVS